MVDAEDLKSFDHCDRVGSSPTIPTTNKKPPFGGCFYCLFSGASFEFSSCFNSFITFARSLSVGKSQYIFIRRNDSFLPNGSSDA